MTAVTLPGSMRAQTASRAAKIKTVPPRSRPATASSCLATASGIAQSRLIEYRDASHGIVLTERDRVVGDLRSFIAG